MSISGRIEEFKIITLEDELNTARYEEDRGIESYIKAKHRTAIQNKRYVVKFIVNDARFPKQNQLVNVFIPKGIIDNKLIDQNTHIECSDTACHLKIADVDDWFDRAMNGASQIHDIRLKTN